jgi:hypothetical protein
MVAEAFALRNHLMSGSDASIEAMSAGKGKRLVIENPIRRRPKWNRLSSGRVNQEI